MIKAPIRLQDLRRRLYVKAKAEPSWCFWGLHVHVCKHEMLMEAHRLTKANAGAPGSDGVTPVLCPVRAPNCNAFAERFVRSIKG